jgi:hypothetical protein
MSVGDGQITPGSLDAIALGCTCSAAVNRSGWGKPHDTAPRFHCDPACPLHGVDVIFAQLRKDAAVKK